ncbi:MAG: hypothetical protein AB4050_17665 [Synechococcus sp.]
MVELATLHLMSAQLLFASLLAIFAFSTVAAAEPSLDSDPVDSDLAEINDARLTGLFPDRVRIVVAQQSPFPEPEVLQLSVSRDSMQDPATTNPTSNGTPALNLQLSTTSTLLQDSDDTLSRLVDTLAQSFPSQPTLVATVQGLMPLYLRSVQNVEEERLGIRSVRSSMGEGTDSINQLLEQFSNRYHCNLAWQSPLRQSTTGIAVDHYLAVQRSSFDDTSLCQPLRSVERLSLLTRLTFVPLDLGEFAHLDWGTINYQVIKDGDDNITGSIGISPSVVIQPISGLSLQVEHNLEFQGDSETQENWFVAAHSHQTGAIASVHLPNVVGNQFSVLAESAYDWVTEEWKSSEITVVWNVLPLGIRWEANTHYLPSQTRLNPVELTFQHELPWNVRWGFRTHYHQEKGELDPLDFTFDHDLPLMEWLAANRSDESPTIPLGLRYGVQTQQVDRDTVDYAVGVGVEIGDQETGQWDFRLDWDGINVDSLSTSYDRADWRMLVRVEPDPDDYSVEGRLTLFPGN